MRDNNSLQMDQIRYVLLMQRAEEEASMPRTVWNHKCGALELHISSLYELDHSGSIGVHVRFQKRLSDAALLGSLEHPRYSGDVAAFP